MSSIAVYSDYVAACEARDIDRVMAFYTEDSLFHNMSDEPLHGLAAIRGLLEGFFSSCSKVRFETLAICEASDGVVLTERLDSFCIALRWRTIKVIGAVEVADGKLKAWREYCDSRQMKRAFS